MEISVFKAGCHRSVNHEMPVLEGTLDLGQPPHFINEEIETWRRRHPCLRPYYLISGTTRIRSQLS